MYRTLLGGFVREFGYSFEEAREGARNAVKLCERILTNELKELEKDDRPNKDSDP